jgi:putative phage-type endonuclease
MDRQGFLGSSDAAAVLGLSRWSTPLQVWAEKTGQIEPKDISDKLAVRLGVALEQTVADLFMEETEKRVFKVSENQVHPNYPFITCQIDRRVVGEDALLECKTCSAWKAKEWEGEEIPQEYIVQVQHQLAVTGKAYGYIAVLIGNQDFKWKRIDRDDKAINEMISREVTFWNDYVIPKVMPAVISCNDSETLYKLFEKAVPDSVLALDDNINQTVEDIQAAETDKKSLEGLIEQKKNILKSLLGENECGVSSQFKITWKNQSTTRLDTKSIKEEIPSVYQKYSKTTETRVLRISENKGDK